MLDDDWLLKVADVSRLVDHQGLSTAGDLAAWRAQAKRKPANTAHAHERITRLDALVVADLARDATTARDALRALIARSA